MVSREEFEKLIGKVADETSQVTDQLYSDVRKHQCDECKYAEFCDALDYFCPAAHKVVEMSF